jgi:BirA family transcriptional regulator, biotin operon repressor / biotin---[acetyl-CoA-carboxylase] ligase
MPLDIEFVRRRLPGRIVSYFPSIDSTMPEAARLAAAGCGPGTAVVADEQTSGQGRYGRYWHSEPDSGLYASIVLRPALSSSSLPVLMLALGLATAEAIARSTNLACDIRWPNDVLIDEKKVAGILVQLQDRFVIAGIGINVNHAGFPPDLAGQATSLRAAAGKMQSREQVLVALLPAVESFCRMLVDGGKEGILNMFYRSSSYAHGKRVVVEAVDGVIEGTTAGLDPSGFLMVEQEDGTKRLIVAGGVRAAGTRRRQ